MKNFKSLLQDFFNRSKKSFQGNGTLLFKKDEYDFKVHVSLCIFRTIQTSVLDSLFKLMVCQKPKVTVSTAVGDSLIDRARCREASDFLNYSDADVLLMVDDDIQFLPEDAIKICKGAYERKGIMAGTCVVKREEGTWIASKPLEDSPPIIFSADAEPVEVKWAGAGMIAFHRNVLTDMIQGMRDYESDPAYECKKVVNGDGSVTYVSVKEIIKWKFEPLILCHPTDLRFWPFFQTMIWRHPNGDHLFLSEDWAFCERARMCGYKIWLDPSVRTVHWGVYGYTLDDMLRPPRVHHEKITYEDAKDKIIIPKDEGVKLNPSLI